MVFYSFYFHLIFILFFGCCDFLKSTTALHHLNQAPLFGKQLQVNYSKHQNVQMPKGNEEEPGKFTRDYSNSPLHRFVSFFLPFFFFFLFLIYIFLFVE
jgi:hypothetical protein